MSRTSSPGIYSRSSSKSMPRPLKWLKYAPTIMSLTRRLVRTSTRRTDSSNSVMVMTCWWCLFQEFPRIRTSGGLWHGYGIEYLLDELVRRDGLGLGFIGEDDSMPQDVRTNILHIFGCDIRPALE